MWRKFVSAGQSPSTRKTANESGVFRRGMQFFDCGRAGRRPPEEITAYGAGKRRACDLPATGQLSSDRSQIPGCRVTAKVPNLPAAERFDDRGRAAFAPPAGGVVSG